ncbi:MAG TPA: ABC transporter ATP-binding protein [Candidatus Dormibacteraeota bacterium]|jgi:branched-chain amino acid transport system ATP-binding protein|nr:ABC transporter ATP-binding protein [Candidatus Dormibacteraeota bacterium]
MLEVEDLHVSYGGVTALDGVNISVPTHGITAVLGPNGAGKSTLLKSIAGLIRPRAGRVTYNGRALIGMAPEEIVRLGVSMVPEGGGVIRELTVEENLRVAQMWHRNGGDARKAIDEVMAMFPPLAARRHNAAHSLSGGERQMLAVGRALVSRAELLLLDEPSLGLAPKFVALIMQTVRKLCAERGISVLLVEQNARSALSIADKAVLLSAGRTVAARSAGELAKNEELWHAYLGY